MENTYAINTTRGKEFVVERELGEMGLHPWVPRALCRRKIPEKKDFAWYDRPYIPKLQFCVIPPVYFRDVLGLKHVIGKPFALHSLDMNGTPAFTVVGTDVRVAARPGLNAFREAVDAEYEATERLRDLGEWECLYRPGDALRIIEGPFEGFPATFQKTLHNAHNGHPMLQLHVEIFGRPTATEVAPDAVV